MAQFENKNLLINIGHTLFENSGGEKNLLVSHETKIQTGFLEGSNVDVVATMVKMISIYRNYEADQKMVHAIDETLEKAVNQIGAVGNG